MTADVVFCTLLSFNFTEFVIFLQHRIDSNVVLVPLYLVCLESNKDAETKSKEKHLYIFQEFSYLTAYIENWSFTKRRKANGLLN